MYAFMSRKKQIKILKNMIENINMPTQQKARIYYTRSALNRRSTYIEPIAKEQPKENIHAYLDLADEV